MDEKVEINHLALSERHVQIARTLLEEQRVRLSRLEAVSSEESEAARQLLMVMTEMLQTAENHRDFTAETLRKIRAGDL